MLPRHLNRKMVASTGFTINGSVAIEGSRPGQTTHCLQVWDRKWGACGPSGRSAISLTSYPC